jgi:translation elongation factor EF-G
LQRAKRIREDEDTSEALLKGAGFLHNRIYKYYLLNIKQEISISFGRVDAEYVIEHESDFMHFNTAFEREGRVYRDVSSETDSSTVFYDIGANVGTYPCLVGDIATNGSVIAIEPLLANAEKIKKNLHKNNINGRILLGAPSNTTGEQELAIGLDGPGNGVNGLLKNSELEQYYNSNWNSKKL